MVQPQINIVDHPSLTRYVCRAPERGLHKDEMVGLENRIIVGDALEVLSSFPENSVDLVHTSPPYNIDKPYELSVSDKSSVEDYRVFLERTITQLKRIVRPGGSIFWQTGYTQNDGNSREIIPIDLLSHGYFRKIPNRFLLWDRIIWRYWGGHAFTKKFTNKHETIMWYVKEGAEPVFSADAVRERAKEYDKRNNFWGRNPGNVWEVDRVAFGAMEQTSHIAVFPEEISERIVRACSNIGDLVLDPFAGSGTLPKVAHGLGRRWFGIEISPVYANESAIRVGYQQPSEPESLASELIKTIAFDTQKGILPLDVVQRKVFAWVNGIPLQQLRDAYDRDVATILENDNGRSTAKRDIWIKYDSKIQDRGTSSDPVRIADHLLTRCYRLRRHFNGVTRFRSAISALITVAEGLRDESDVTYLTSVVQQEPSSFDLTSGLVRLFSLGRRVSVIDPIRNDGRHDAEVESSRKPQQGQILI